MPIKRIVYTFGVNDADYKVKSIVLGKKVNCPFYLSWSSMLRRCYSAEFHKRNPTYKVCTVCDEWLLFSNFKKWMENQDWEGKYLDKDILTQGNKTYSPINCLFVSMQVNSLFNEYKKGRGKHKRGVTLNKRLNKYIAQCTYKGGRFHLGCFNNETDAFKVYKLFKYMVIAMLAEKQTEPLKSSMLNYKIQG
jgi:hypothetical protein